MCSTKNVFYLHLTLLPYLSTSDEIKTKPTQHSVQALRGMGIQPDSIICRSEKDIEVSTEETSQKKIEEAKIIEENSNQILDFTREVKGLPEQDKIKIIEALWSIIYSNKDADIYETNLMRRLAGLLYIDNKTMGDIKEKIKQNLE